MSRTSITNFVKSRGGEIVCSSRKHVAYRIPMTESVFLKWRQEIPFQTLWNTGTEHVQIFVVYYVTPIR